MVNPPKPSVFLVDNGSLRPAATLSLRALCRRLQAVLGCEVVPVSIMHSNQVAPALLDGQPAEIFEQALRRRLAEGIDEFIVLPLFFGPSRAITKFIPLASSVVRSEYLNLRVRVAESLVTASAPDDHRVAQILTDQVRQTIRLRGLLKPHVVTVDHGSPIAPVTEVRNLIGQQMQAMLGDEVGAFSVASMERRDGPEYAFNDPLLGYILRQPPFCHGPVVVSMMFLNPGRHAGPGGDVESICQDARETCPNLQTFPTELVSEHPLLLSILKDRYRQALQRKPL